MNPKVKVLHIIKSLGRGGAEMLLPETLRLHDKVGFEFHYAYFLPWKNQMVESIRDQGGKVICFEANNNVVLMMKVRVVARYIRENKIQLVHAHLPWAGILARLVGKLTGVPVIYTEHNKQERYHFATRFINLFTMDLLSTVVAVSADVAESIHRHKPRLDVPVRTILNGVNIDTFYKPRFIDQNVRQKLSIPTDSLIIGTIAVFRFQKRLDLWMETAATIVQQFKHVHFIIVGDGPLKNELLQKCSALGMEDRIHFPGLETDVRPYLASFDIYMMTSLFEGLPIALLEAMAMECPIITTDAGGIKEVIRHELDGLVCRIDEPEMLAKFAYSLIQSPELRMRYGKQARKRVAEDFSLEQMVGKLEALYRTMIKAAD